MKRNTLTALAGLAAVLFFFVSTELGIKKLPNLIEPGPRLMPYVALFLIMMSSVALLVQGLRDKSPEKPYFPQGGVRKITLAYLELFAYGVALSVFGFLISTPFAMMAFIRRLKGDAQVRWYVNALVSLAVTACIYLLFVRGFSIKLPQGVIF